MLDRIAAFITELSQRRVLRVGAVYLVFGWGAIEVADTLFPNLGIPRSAVTLVIVLVAIGLPIALALAWAFDHTPEGFRRAAPTPAAAAAARRPSGPRRRRWLAVGAVALALLPIAWWTWPGRREARRDTDTSLVAVLPFRVSGASGEVAYLREGVLDLLAATLDGGELRTVAPGVVTRATSGADLETVDAASTVARSLGAGLFVTGEVVGSPQALIVTARMIDAHTGEEIGRARAERSGEELHALTDELAGQLLAIRYGTPAYKLADLTTASLPALRMYLEGRQEFRAGNYREAFRLFDDAVELDSTFAQAAVDLYRTRSWANFVESRNGDRAARLAWSGRERLNTVDRAALEALLGPRYPRPSSGRELLEAWQRVTSISPDRPEHWYGLADIYFHTGVALGIADAAARADTHMRKALELDSTNVEAIRHLLELAVLRGDTASVAEYSDRLVRIDPEGEQTRGALWIRHLMGMPGGRDVGLDTLPVARLSHLAIQHMAVFLGAHAVGDALEAAESEDGATSGVLIGVSFPLAALRGRVETMRRLVDRAVQPGYWTHVSRLLTEYGYGDAESQRRALALWDARPAQVEGAPANVAASRTGALISAAHTRLQLGDLSTYATDLREIEEAETDTGNAGRSSLGGLASVMLPAHHAHVTGARDVIQRLTAAEEYLAPRPGVTPHYQELSMLILARIHYEREEFERALELSRRAVLPRYYFGSLLYLEEGRAAEALGRREEAISAYREFIRWNEHAQGVTRDKVDDARLRLARLLPDA